jgi:hypothetical protein
VRIRIISVPGRVGSNAKVEHHLYINNNLACHGLRVGEGFRYVVDRSKRYARGDVNSEDHDLQNLQGSPKSFKFSKPVIPGILHEDICNDLDEGGTVLDSRTIVGEPRVGRELGHVQYVFNESLELVKHFEATPHTW